MAGSEGNQPSNGGGFDLLRRATQAMMSKYVTPFSLVFIFHIFIFPLQRFTSLSWPGPTGGI